MVHCKTNSIYSNTVHMQMPWFTGKHGQHIKFGIMVIIIIMNRCLKLVSPSAFNVMLYGRWKVFILQVKKYHYIDFWISSKGLHYTWLSLTAHLNPTLNTAHLFVKLSKVPIKQSSTTGCRLKTNMLHLVVLWPRYIKKINMYLSKAIMTQVLKFGVILKQQCLLKCLDAFSHMFPSPWI